MTHQPHQSEDAARVMNLSVIEKAAREATPGPWRVVVDEHPHYLGGTHKERRIATQWEHPQLRGPMHVVTGGVGLGELADGPMRHMVSISAADAEHIAACDPLTILDMCAVVRAAQTYAIARVTPRTAESRWLGPAAALAELQAALAALSEKQEAA